MYSLASLAVGMGVLPAAVAANVPRQVTATGTSTGAATGASTTSTTLSPTFIFSAVDDMNSCEPATIDWIYAGPDADVRLEISSIDVTQSSAPASTTMRQTTSRSLHLTITDGTVTQPQRRQATGIITSQAASATGAGGLTSLISTSIPSSDRTYRWSSVSVPQGWYRLNASIPSRNYVARTSANFFVRNGTDTSCLVGSGASNSATSPQSNSATSPTSSSSSTAVAIGAISSNNSVDAGTIAGAVIGAVAGLALLAGVLVWFLRRRKRPRNAPKQPKPYAGMHHQHRGSDGSQGHILSHASHGSTSESTVGGHASDGTLGGHASPTSMSEEKLEGGGVVVLQSRGPSQDQQRRASVEHRRTPSYPPTPTPDVTPPAVPAATVTRSATRNKTPRKPVPSYIAAEESMPPSPVSPTTSNGHATSTGHAALNGPAPALVHRSSDGSVNAADTTPVSAKSARRKSTQSGRGGERSSGRGGERSSGKGDRVRAEQERVGHYAVGRAGTLDNVRPDLKNKNSWDDRPMHYLIPDMPPSAPQ
ncbi:hypothetical protein BD626DRAFT_505070 [Schizophyllum amplum]|uniref:Ser-Thr-rich glycosyl-phosphatidyl-inositol-anchored membrane family-domain-containing protein n=1 Tax=Schizophyllum amplum TaxID=97359 RepID=A0A550C6C7_9AGAR|nr:hypothetical protein BD626DRAFT_505070 [Auriculariopsis ampla]